MAKSKSSDFKKQIVSEGLSVEPPSLESKTPEAEELSESTFRFNIDSDRLFPGTDLTLLERAKRNEVLPANFLWAESSKECAEDAKSRQLRDMVAAEAQKQTPALEQLFPNNGNRGQVADATAYPFSAICCIYSEFPGRGTYMGSGCLISHDVVLTVAHNVYRRDFGQKATTVRVMRGVNGTMINVKTAARYWYHPSYPTVSDISKRPYDYALIKLSSPYTTGGFLGVAVYSNTNFSERENYHITGYPSDKPRLTMWSHQQRKLEAGTNVLRYQIDTVKGQSGSAIIDHHKIDDKSHHLVVGVHSGYANNRNEGVRITETVWRHIEPWI